MDETLMLSNEYCIGKFGDKRLCKTGSALTVWARSATARGTGLFIHPVLAIDANSRDCLGIAYQQARVRTKAAARNYELLPIEEKESYRWLQVAQAARQTSRSPKHTHRLPADHRYVAIHVPQRGVNMAITVRRVFDVRQVLPPIGGAAVFRHIHKADIPRQRAA